MKEILASLITGFLWGLIPFGLLEVMGWKVPFIRRNFYENPKHLVFGYHIHHSVLGILSIVWGIYSLFSKSGNPYFLIGLGLGIIVIHTIADKRLVFIERAKPHVEKN